LKKERLALPKKLKTQAKNMAKKPKTWLGGIASILL